MGVTYAPGGIHLATNGEVMFDRMLGQSCEQQVAEHVRFVLKRRMACEQRCLDRHRPAVVKPSELTEGGSFDLPLVQVVAEEVGDAVDVVAEIRVQPAWIWDLEMLVGIAADEGDPVVVVDEMVDVTEGLALLGFVVNRGRGPVDAFDAELVLAEIARKEIIGRACRAAILDTRLNSAMAAAVE